MRILIEYIDVSDYEKNIRLKMINQIPRQEWYKCPLKLVWLNFLQNFRDRIASLDWVIQFSLVMRGSVDKLVM